MTDGSTENSLAMHPTDLSNVHTSLDTKPEAPRRFIPCAENEYMALDDVVLAVKSGLAASIADLRMGLANGVMGTLDKISGSKALTVFWC